MNKRQAYLMGRETGNGIAEHNYYDFINDAPCEINVENFQLEVSQIESEHYRQFSPFEFTAQAFNESKYPDEVWAEYERGVWNGSKQTFHKLNRGTR